MKQVECVFMIVTGFLGAKFKPGTDAKGLLSKEDLAKIHLMVFEQFKAGKVDLKTDFTDEELTKYIPGLVNNHLRKDDRLNGGVKYEAKNPGTMTGNIDPEIKELRKVFRALESTNPTAAARVKVVLDQKVEAWKKRTGKSVEIDLSKLSPEVIKIYEENINRKKAA